MNDDMPRKVNDYILGKAEQIKAEIGAEYPAGAQWLIYSRLANYMVLNSFAKMYRQVPCFATEEMRKELKEGKE